MTIEERKPCIYKATSKTTGKSYIGQSKDGLNHRRNSHYIAAFNKMRNTPFAIALRELGKEDFEWEILEIVEAKSRIELQNKLNHYEKYYINKYNSYKEGYNANEGGNGGIKYKYRTLEEKTIFKRVGQRLRKEPKREQYNVARKAKRDADPTYWEQRKEYRKQKEEANPELREERNKKHKEYMKQNQQSRRLAKKAKLGQEAYREAYNERRRQRKLKQKESLNS